MKASTLITGAGVVGIALILSSAYLLDGPDDTQAAQDSYDAQAEMRAAAPGSLRREIAAQHLCNEARGPNSEPRWLADGSLACTTRRGLRAAL